MTRLGTTHSVLMDSRFEAQVHKFDVILSGVVPDRLDFALYTHRLVLLKPISQGCYLGETDERLM